MDKYLDQAGFISGRIHAMKLRLDKAMRRVERNDTNLVEAERAKRLAKLITLHETSPDEAMLLYNKDIPVSVLPEGDNLTEAIRNFQEE